MQDICQCLLRTIQRQGESIESILQNAGTRQMTSHNADDIVPFNRNEGLNPTQLLTMLFVFLCFVALMSLRRPTRPMQKQMPLQRTNEGPPPPPVD